jgi:hypothetical protein
MYNFNNSKEWKQDQLKYFKEYLKSFDKDSREYKKIKSGIKDLEKNL